MKNNAAKAALNQFKMEAANEVGVNLKQGYNGDLTSKQAGSIGGQMVNDAFPIRNEKKYTYMRKLRTNIRHEINVVYDCSIKVIL